MEGDKATVIDADSSFEGRLTGKDGRILGTFQGEIELQGRLHLGEGSKVEAKVRAASAEIAGEFKGDLVVQSLTLLEKARVSGTVDAQTLAVREGAVVNAAVSAGTQRARPAASAPLAPKPPLAGTVSG